MKAKQSRKELQGSEESGSGDVDHLLADLYENLEELAKQKRVSLAWVVRDASERYVASEVTQGKVGGRP